jgi:soluble lytic murein transglycosylase-like protein
LKLALLLAATMLIAAPVQAQDPLAPLPQQPTVPVQAPPASATPPASAVPPAAFVQPMPAPVIQIPRSWNEVFAALRSGRWREAEAGIAILPRHVLSPVAKAELYTAKGSPMVPLDRLLALLSEAPDLPNADQLARLAATRGATSPPPIAQKKRTIWLGNAPGRTRARPVGGEPMADQLRTALDPLVKSDSAVQAEMLLMQYAPLLSFNARAEAGQRVAWAYYAGGRDADARRVADSYRVGATSDWGPHAAWVSGLASSRLGDCNSASRALQEVASTSRERELSAAAYYWAARSEQACRRPFAVAPLLRAAARHGESFYGLLARETLGTETRLPADPHSFAANVRHLNNVQRAVELVKIGERALGEEMLRHQARIGHPQEHHGLIEFAKQLDLAGAQFWLAHNGQRGALADAQDRYPVPRWTPLRGWRIDPALALAHIRQESSFRTEVVSPAGAVGLMQVMPGTASDMAKATGLPHTRLNLADPVMNMEFGQSFIERIRTSSATRGQLPKMIAAYNAGPVPVGRWAWLDRGDPLLWIESIPYWETRYYVPAVMRNYWVYQGLMGAEANTLRDVAQHRWPSLPTSVANLSR